MKIIGLFNNKGGVGKTTLTYHLAHMFALQGVTTLVADLDPQANLTASFLSEEELETLWAQEDDSQSIYQGIKPIYDGLGDIRTLTPREIRDHLYLIAGDLRLSNFEDRLSDTWPRCYEKQPDALRATTAFFRCLQQTAQTVQAEMVLVDVGPNLGAINRAALLATDYILVPLAADLFSIQGLRNLGPMLSKWREGWQRILQANAGTDILMPSGQLKALGYVILQHSIRLDRPVKSYERYLAQIPLEFRKAFSFSEDMIPASDPYQLGQIRHYRSMIPLSQEANKPVFELKPADGAFGGHVRLVQVAYDEFKTLTEQIQTRVVHAESTINHV